MRFAISKLKKSQELSTRRSGLFLLVTIVKYDDYQSNRVENDSNISTKLAPDYHEISTRLSINNNVNNDNNVNNIRTMDIKVLKDAYLKNNRLHQLTYNKTTLNIRPFKLILRAFLWFSINFYKSLNF